MLCLYHFKIPSKIHACHSLIPSNYFLFSFIFLMLIISTCAIFCLLLAKCTICCPAKTSAKTAK